MPQGIYNGFYCLEEHGKFKPNPHQKATMKYFLKSKYKGLLLYHKLGSGKTCTSIMIADKMLEKGLVNHVYVLSPGSLRAGWTAEYCEICGKSSDYLEEKFTFITYNYTVGNRIPDLNGSLVIIDEVHNLINGVKNQSKHTTLIYDKLKNSDCRILALSGTPIFQYVYEWPILGNLLKPEEFPEIVRGNQLDTEAFMKYFDIENDGTLKPKNKTKVKRMLEGIVSYFPGSTEEFYPTITHMPPIKVLMSMDQEKYYWGRREQEKKLFKPPPMSLFDDREKYKLLNRLYIMARQKILTRTASNFYYGKYKKRKDALVKEGGWIEPKRFRDKRLGTIYSMKVVAFLTNVLIHPNQKHVLFTSFKEKAGVNLLHALFSMCGISSTIFSGDLDDSKRSRVLKQFNDKRNRYGEKVQVLLVTEAGAEGISIMEARHMHILESGPRESKIQQAMGRIARYKSHYEMPKSQQNVKIWRYWSMASKDPVTITITVLLPDGSKDEITKTITDKETVDEILYNSGKIAMNRINSFLKLLQQVSVT